MKDQNYTVQYTVQIQKDENGELFIELPEALLESVGWKIGDNIQFDADDDDEQFKMTKIE